MANKVEPKKEACNFTLVIDVLLRQLFPFYGTKRIQETFIADI
jgi:hypothetical protein